MLNILENNKDFPRGIEVVCSAIVRRPSDGKILITQSSSKWSNKWMFPGGHIDPGESIFEAAGRELQEETGILAKPLGIIYSGELISSKDFHRNTHFVFFDFAFELTHEGTISLDQCELSNYKWVTPEEALTMDLGETYDEVTRAYIEWIGNSY